jgi:hypothetical protein
MREITAVNRASEERRRRHLVTECRQTFGVKAARELWFKLGLETTPSMRVDGPQRDLGFTYTATRRDPEPGAA